MPDNVENPHTNKNNTENPVATSQDENDLLKIVSAKLSEDTHINEDMKPFDEGSTYALQSLLILYNKYYENKNNTNIVLRKRYFNCSFALLFILVFGFIGTTLLVCFFVKNNLAIIISLVSSIGGLVPSVLLLPRIIGDYIFNKNEYDGTKDLMESFKNSKNNKDKQ